MRCKSGNARWGTNQEATGRTAPPQDCVIEHELGSSLVQSLSGRIASGTKDFSFKTIFLWEEENIETV
jgi:hypothetical protein